MHGAAIFLAVVIGFPCILFFLGEVYKEYKKHK